MNDSVIFVKLIKAQVKIILTQKQLHGSKIKKKNIYETFNENMFNFDKSNIFSSHIYFSLQ